MSVKVIATNRKAKHDYFILDSFEAGLVLQGSEIKSIRGGQISLNEAYIRTDGIDAWLIDAYIAPYKQANIYNHDPKRPRKLLLHAKEIEEIHNNVKQKGVTIIPLRVYMKSGLAKVEIAIAKGKKNYDKRADLAKRDAEREIQRHLRRK
jgi:SsrA-binding protein